MCLEGLFGGGGKEPNLPKIEPIPEKEDPRVAERAEEARLADTRRRGFFATRKAGEIRDDEASINRKKLGT
jgi:hypothetical protein